MTALVLHGASSPLSTVASAQLFDSLTTKQTLVHCHFPMQTLGKFLNFPIPLAQSFWDRQQLFLATLGTWDLTTKVAWTSADVVAGKYDVGLIAMAWAIRDWKHPFMLRLDHEMQGSWAPWFMPGPQFVALWQHIWQLFEDEGATNTTWVWCPNQIDPILGDRIAEWYPGDDYVDWTGFDAYNPASSRGDSWQSWAQVSTLSYTTLLKLAPTKPMLIGEFGSHTSPGNKAQWLTDCLAYIAQQQPAIRAISYYQKLGDPSTAHPTPAQWPLSASDGSAGAYSLAIRSGPFASTFDMPPDLRPLLPLYGASTWGPPVDLTTQLTQATATINENVRMLASADVRHTVDTTQIADLMAELAAAQQSTFDVANRLSALEVHIRAVVNA